MPETAAENKKAPWPHQECGQGEHGQQEHGQQEHKMGPRHLKQGTAISNTFGGQNDNLVSPSSQ